ncbi:MAG: hypothetical protein LUD81_03250 [Clostridiales bacterium]|nr:hypothetical protein [Clostridiales bacterium]
MTLDYIRQAIKEANDVYFDYHGKRAGIEFTGENGIFTFIMWFGKGYDFEEKTFPPSKLNDDIIDKVFNEKFFDGKSLVDLIDVVEIDFA